MISDLEDKEYSRYRDDMKDFETDRDYYYTKHRDSASDAMDVYRFDTNTTYNIDKDAYGRMRDGVEDAMWKTELENENKSKEFAELTRLIQSIYGKKSYNNDALPFIDLWKTIYYN